MDLDVAGSSPVARPSKFANSWISCAELPHPAGQDMAIDKPTAHALHYRRSLSHSAHGADPFRPLEPECQVVQFSQPLSESELRRAGALVAGRPDIQLYVYGNASRDLDFLSHFPGLKRLQLALHGLEDASGIANVAGSLEEFRFGPTKKTFSLQFLDAMPALRGLFLAGHKKNLAAVQAAGKSANSGSA